MNDSAYNTMNFEPRRVEENDPRPAIMVALNPGPLAPLQKEITMCILRIWREHREQLIKQRLRLL